MIAKGVKIAFVADLLAKPIINFSRKKQNSVKKDWPILQLQFLNWTKGSL